MSRDLHVKYPLFLSEFPRQFRKILKHQLRKNSSVAVEMFHADGQGDMTKRIVTFRNFANVPKNQTEFMNPESVCKFMSKQYWYPNTS